MPSEIEIDIQLLRVGMKIAFHSRIRNLALLPQRSEMANPSCLRSNVMEIHC